MGALKDPVRALVVTPAERKEADRALAEASDLLRQSVRKLGSPTNPLEAARIQTEYLKLLVSETGVVVADMRRSAVLTVYARGRADSGHFGFGSIATALELSKSRVQQIIGAYTDGKKGDDAGDRTRAQADQLRTKKKKPVNPDGNQAS